MNLLLSTARRTRTTTPKWICLTCHKSATPRRSVSTVFPPASVLREKIGPARTRFAPSPTGYLHLGSLRTALFNYLIAKATGGAFLLRIEDTDQKRTIPDAEERLFKDLEWAGIKWDEGPKIGGPYGPYRQSERTALYREHAERLLKSGHAYRCFCSPERLNIFAKNRAKQGLPPDYDRTCVHIPKEESEVRSAYGEAHVVRLLVPDEYPVFNDLVYGLVRHKKQNMRPLISTGAFDDPILLKSDGFPTYHLANVVDDHLMKITHVVRGSEWMSSTPKHLAMYQAFGWEPPQYAHVGLLLDQKRQKLSKRAESANLADLKDKLGVFPDALTNYVALLGWSHNTGNDVMILKELIDNASLKYTRGDAVVTPDKLWFLQKRHAARYASISPEKEYNPSHDLRKLAVEPVLKLLSQFSAEQPHNFVYYLSLDDRARAKYVQDIVYIDALSCNYTTPFNCVTRNKHFFVAPTPEDLANSISIFKLRGVPSDIKSAVPTHKLLRSVANFAEIPEKDWNTDAIKSWTNSIIGHGSAESLAELPGIVFEEAAGAEALVKKAWSRLVHGYIRWALMGGMPGPDGAETMRMLGKEETMRRFDAAREVARNRMENEWSGSMDV